MSPELVWIQCDASGCRKWRKLPEYQVAEVAAGYWECRQAVGGSCSIPCHHCPAPCDCLTAVVPVSDVSVSDVPDQPGFCYVVAGAQASKHFKLLVKCRNGLGSPWVKWIAHCPRCNIDQGLDREGHPEVPPDNRSLQTFLDKHRHHDAEFAHMTVKSLTFRVPLHDRYLFEKRSAAYNTASEEDGVAPEEDFIADGNASPRRMCPSTPPMESSQPQSLIAGQAEAAACTPSLNISNPALPPSGPALLCATTAKSEVPMSDEPGQQHAKPACLPCVNRITNYFQPVRALTGAAASCARVSPVGEPRWSVDLEACVPEAGEVVGAKLSKQASSLHLSNKLDKSFRTPSAVASGPPAATAQASTLTERNPAASRAVGACACSDGLTNTSQHDSAEATDMDLVGLVCNEQLSSSRDTETASDSHSPIKQHHTVCHPSLLSSSQAGPEAHSHLFGEHLLLNQPWPPGTPQSPLCGNVAAARLAALLSPAAIEAGMIASQPSAAAAAVATRLCPTQILPMSAAEPTLADAIPATAPEPATVKVATPAGAGASGKLVPKQATFCAAELASVPALEGATAAAPLPGRARQTRNEVEHIGFFSWDGRSEEHPPNLDKVQTTCVKRQSAPAPRYIAELDRPQDARRASSSGERHVLDQEAWQGPAKPSARTTAGGSAGGTNANWVCHEQHGGTGAEVDMEQSASLPTGAGATAAAPLSCRSRPARNEAERLVPFSWDGMSREYPPNPDQFQPTRLKRQSERPPRFVTESSQPQHAHRTKSNGKRQKLDQQPCTRPAGNTQHCHVSNGVFGLSSAPAGAYKRKMTAHSDRPSPHAASDQQALPSDRARADGRPGLAAFADRTQSLKSAAQGHTYSLPSAPLKAAQSVAASSMCNVFHVKEENVGINNNRTTTSYAATPALQPSIPSSDMHSNRYSAEPAKRCGVPARCISNTQCPALDHTVYDHQECCSGMYDFDVDAMKPGLSAALLPLKLRKSKLKGQFRWGTTYPIKENRFGSRGDYKRCLDFQKTQFAEGAQIVLPRIKDVLEAVAYSSATQQQTLRAKHWARQEGVSTSGQYTLWHEQQGYRRLHKEIISSMIFHLQEMPTQSSAAQSPCDSAGASLPMNAVVEVMFVATKLEHRKKKFFVQLLRLFMREYLLKHYQQIDLLVMATPQATIEWGDAKLARQLGTNAFILLDDQHPLVAGRVKCTDCNWLHLAIDQSLITSVYS